MSELKFVLQGVGFPPGLRGLAHEVQIEQFAVQSEVTAGVRRQFISVLTGV
jgi:hypothetical protein